MMSGWLGRRAAGTCVVAVVMMAGWFATLGAVSASAATTTFNTPGSYSFTVPLGVTHIAVSAIGAAGGACGSSGTVNAAGGEGAAVSAVVPVTPGQQLVVQVAGVGGDCPWLAAGTNPAAGTAGTGGGGLGGSSTSGPGGAGGGGTSLVGPSAWPGSQQPLVLAGGGGGASYASPGGNAGSAGTDGTVVGSGGGAGTQSSSSGTGGFAGSGANPGASGSAGVGGAGGAAASNAPAAAGAGGGGGYYGGGGGGGSADGAFGGGGGGGSSFVASDAASATLPTPSEAAAAVTINYTVAASPTARISAPSSGNTYALGKSVGTAFACSEGTGGAGLASCNASTGTNTLDGGAGDLNTSTPGKHTFTVTALSKDGLTATASITYTVTAPRIAIKTARISVLHGKGSLKLACSGAVVCHGKLTLKLHGRVAVTTHYSVRSGSKKLVVHLSRKGVEMLTQAHRLTGPLHVTVTSGRSVTKSVTVILKS